MQAQATGPLPRGKACLPCRQRRVKCDGVRPACRRCQDKKRQCIFQDLDESLGREAATPEEPSREYRRRGMNVVGFDPGLLPLRWWEVDEPPIFFAHLLVTNFLSTAQILGFFLDPERFMQSFETREPFGHPSRPSPALLSAIYVWGIVLSKSPDLIVHEPVFLSRALHYISMAPTSTHPNRARHALQAELLLANYYFNRGLVSEGRTHCNAAMRIALVHRVHKVAGVVQISGDLGAVEQREWVNAFWMTNYMDLCWTVGTGLPSICPDFRSGDDRVDVPWPIDSTQFRKATQVQDIGEPPLTSLFENPSAPLSEGEEPSFIAMECKAAVLLHHAHKITIENPTDPDKVLAEHTEMSRIIYEFHGLISPIVPGGRANWRLMMAHTLTLFAMLRLDTSRNSTRKSVKTALAVISLLNHTHPEELKPINPMIGFLWYGVGQMLVDESHRLGETSGSSLSLDGNGAKIAEAINLLCYYMEECGHDCPYIATQHRRLEARRQGISSGSERSRSVEFI